MDAEESVSYDLLFRDYNFENTKTVLPLLRKCLTKSKDETEIERALEIALCYCLKNFSSRKLEEELFEIACPTAKNFILGKLEYLKKNPETCFEHLAVVLKVITYFQGVFEYLCEIERLTFLEVKSLLLATCEILYTCYSHCKISEEVYGLFFSAATECLSNFFKNCCSLQDQLLNFVSEKLDYDVENDREVVLLNDVLTHLSKCGIILIYLEIKTMAKVWKTFTFLIQKYLTFLKDTYNISETITQLCGALLPNVETALNKNDENIPKIIKLSCFLLKLVVKFCEIFRGSLKDCQKHLLSLLLLLCLYDAHHLDKSKENASYEVINQLTIGTDPLMTHMMTDIEMVKECSLLSKDNGKPLEFVILCCLILKKLMESNRFTRSLWLNDNQNILQWIFNSASCSEFVTSCIHLPNILVNGKQKKFTDIYEYVLVTICAFSMTASTEEYRHIEKSLICNILQTEPIRALLAIDIWCLLARFASSELCLSQIIALGKIYQQFNSTTTRPESWYLGSLIKRLFPLLSERHRETFFKAFQSSFYSTLWSGKATNGLTLSEVYQVRRMLFAEVDQLLEPVRVDSHIIEAEIINEMNESLGKRIGRLWKFDSDILSSACHSVRLLRVCCVLTASFASEVPSVDLLLVLTQIKRLLKIGQCTAVKLYFASVLGALSTVRIPSNQNQKKTIAVVSDAFRALLCSPSPLAKQKAFDAFYYFSHTTSHPEVISLSVQHSADLRLEMANYFRRITSEPKDWPNYIRGLYVLKFKHVCNDKKEEEVLTSSKRMKMWSPNMQETVIRWKEDTRKLLEHYQELCDSQKNEIKNICNSILSLP